MGYKSSSKLEFLRPVKHANDSGLTEKAPMDLANYNFLLTGITREVDQKDNSVTIDPVALQLPWPSSFPAARQSKYWLEAEAAGKDLLQQVREASCSLPGRLPENFSQPLPHRELSVMELDRVANASGCAVYMHPDCGKTEVSIISKLDHLIWLHDDVVETQSFDSSESTITEIIVRYWPEILVNPQSFHAYSGDWFVKLALEIMSANTQGPGLMRAFFSWMGATRLETREDFTSLREYLDYRAVDIGQDYIFACVRFSENIQLSKTEEDPLGKLKKLSIDHIILVNDSFSYEKEIQDSRRHKSPCINAIKYIGDTLAIEKKSAKKVAGCLLRTLESQICEEYKQLQDSEVLNLSQVRTYKIMRLGFGNNFLSTAHGMQFQVALY
ncbi:terpene synthase family protein [Aspergillus affinis]|uniref:terpene synthase family protein n=1 Tax=Aspergillus affinis TaxID=1070780 RepID=UPI0022FE0669|nr:terpenoid synthase [Aspergillus affinis]KAI9043099.1 terpenoid synthase [Aspergillus affinis]